MAIGLILYYYIFMTVGDLILTPLYIFIFYKIMKHYQAKYYANTYQGKVMEWGFWSKILGSIFVSCIYEFYYRGGDVEGYYTGATGIYNAFFTNLVDFYGLITFDPEAYMQNFSTYKRFKADSSTYQLSQYIYTRHWLNLPELTTIKVFGIAALLTMRHYTTMAIIASMASFVATWKLFLLFSNIYKDIQRNLAIACFFIPTAIVWGSGLLKDPITYSSLVFLVVFAYEFIVQKKWSFLRLFAIVMSIYFILAIKPYILICAVPALALFATVYYINAVENKLVKILLLPFMLLVFSIVLVLLSNRLVEQLGKYSIENLQNTAKSFQNWHAYEATLSGGAGYTLGDIDFTPLGIAKTIPLAINVTFFRPYLWEARKPMIFISAIESLLVMLLTLRVLYRVGIFNTFKIIVSDPFIVFCIVFSLFFGFAVGFTSYNFGALTRYKLPCMSFFVIGLFLIEYEGYTLLKKPKQIKIP
jgi:hypothetical protein